MDVDSVSLFASWCVHQMFQYLHFTKGPDDLSQHGSWGRWAEQKSGSWRISVMLKESEGGKDWCFSCHCGLWPSHCVSHRELISNFIFHVSGQIMGEVIFARLYLYGEHGLCWKTQPNRESFECSLLRRKQMKGWTDERCDVSDRHDQLWQLELSMKHQDFTETSSVSLNMKSGVEVTEQTKNLV